ncbi:MAG: hypothetical protein RI897_2586 [Verrucomicrobiota bacterium]
MGVIGGVDQAECDGSSFVLRGGAGDFGGGEAGSEVDHAPALVSGGGGDHGGAEFMELAVGCCDDDAGGIFGDGEWAGGVAEEITEESAGEVFVGGGDGALGPEVTEGLGERGDDVAEEALVAEHDEGAGDDIVEGVGIHLLDGVQAAGFEIFAGGSVGGCGSGGALIHRGGCIDEEFAQGGCVQSGDIADAVTGADSLSEEGEAFDFGFAVEASIRVGPSGGDGSISAFPDPDHVGGESGFPGGHINGVVNLAHKPDVAANELVIICLDFKICQIIGA